ncbi:hypothetical protein [Microcoleus sp. N9_A1]|uniref:hypothetical protein n=1 Tax=Microcoleus sp. N9_A1 TaxID=3055380 RepID=UPI002FD74883
MPVRIISPVSGEIVQANTVPNTVTVKVIADSNLNTDVRFKLNGTIVGIDKSATSINVNGFVEYQYQLNIPIPAAGIHSIEAEDIDQATVPMVRSTDSISFELKLNDPKITLTETTTTLAAKLVTATIANRPTGALVRFSLNGTVVKEDSTSPFNVSVSEPGELKAELVVAGSVIEVATATLQISDLPTPTPTPTPTPSQGPKGDKGDKGDKGEPGIQGIQGERGERGEKGETGAIGSEGIPGPKGDTGATGAQGIKGDTGATGATGTMVWSTPVSLPLSAGVTGSVTYQTCGKLVRLNVDVMMNFTNSSGLLICANMPNTIFNTWFHSTAMIFKSDLTIAATGQWGLIRYQPNNRELALMFDKIVNETVRCVSNFIMAVN